MKCIHARRQAAATGRNLTLILLCLTVLLSGCPKPKPADEPSSGQLAMVGTLRIAVVDDPPMAEAIERFHGEWQGQTGSDFVVEQIAADKATDLDVLQFDAIISPPHMMGRLAGSGKLVAVPENLRKAERSQWPEVFSLLRTREAVWGSEVFGVPFGSPVLVCYCRADLFEKLQVNPPTTWAEYQQLATLLADREKLGDAAPPEDRSWHGTLEPLGPGWAGKVFLARAAAYATHRENYSTLFEIDTMKPLVNGPPFVRALEELVAAAKGGPDDQLSYDPMAVRKAFWQGRSAMALSWPSAADGDQIDAAEQVRVRFAELPGSVEVFDFVDQKWEQRGREEDIRVPLLGVAGRVGLVTKHSEWPDATCQLLLWLADDARSADVAAASKSTTIERPSQFDQIKAWVEPPVPLDAATRYAEQTQTTLTRQQLLFAVRIPGHPQYMAALDEAVRKAVRGEKGPQDALDEAATQWDQITDRLGRQNQAEAYYSSLGLY